MSSIQIRNSASNKLEDSKSKPWWESLKPPPLQRQQAGFQGHFHCCPEEPNAASYTRSDPPTTVSTDFDDYSLDPHLDMLKHEEMLASILQEEVQEDERAALQSEQETFHMLSTNTGRAFLFVERVINIVEQLRSTMDFPTAATINAIANDDMVFLAEKLLNTQDLFLRDGRPYTIDLGYHNTVEKNVERIKTDGLLTKQERTRRQIYSAQRGSCFGDGVYTANNPFAFKRFGEVGLLVARLQGRTVRSGSRCLASTDEFAGFDTVIGNKRESSLVLGDHLTQHEEIVLRSSSQSLPLIKFSTSLLPHVPVGRANMESPILKFHQAMQNLVDEFFNAPRTLEQATSQQAQPRNEILNPSDSVARVPEPTLLSWMTTAHTIHSPKVRAVHSPEATVRVSLPLGGSVPLMRSPTVSESAKRSTVAVPLGGSIPGARSADVLIRLRPVERIMDKSCRWSMMMFPSYIWYKSRCWQMYLWNFKVRHVVFLLECCHILLNKTGSLGWDIFHLVLLAVSILFFESWSRRGRLRALRKHLQGRRNRSLDGPPLPTTQMKSASWRPSIYVYCCRREDAKHSKSRKNVRRYSHD